MSQNYKLHTTVYKRE